MGISLSDAFFIEIDTYFELIDLYSSQFKKEESREATQSDIDSFLL